MKLSEIIDIEILQHIQNGFSDSFELPAIIYDNKGRPITKPSRFTKFCTFVRSTEKGNTNCQKFDALLMKELVDGRKPIIRHGCALKNIITATVPIIINGIHFANFGIGQAIEDDFDFSEIKEYAQEIGVDEDELLEAAKTLIPVNKSLLFNSMKFLHVVATQISVLGYQNLQNRQLIEKIEILNQTLEKRVDERTKELTEANIKLEESNTALKVLLEHRGSEREKFEENVISHISSLVTPYLQRLQEADLNSHQSSLLEIVESNLREVTAQFSGTLYSKTLGLTRREMEIAALIKTGKTNMEIASLLNISERAVSFHRQNLRKKLGLRGRKVNLVAYLNETTLK